MKKRNRRADFDGFERRDDELERHDQMLRAKSRALRQSAEGDQIESDDEVPQEAPGDAAATAKGGPRSRRARRAAQQSKALANREASVIDAENVVQSSRAPQPHKQSTASTTATRGQQRKRGKGRKGRGRYRDDSSSSDGEDVAASKKKMMATAAVERKKAEHHAPTRREPKVPRHLQGQARLKIRGSLPEYMSSLPNEVWAMIIDFLDRKDLLYPPPPSHFILLLLERALTSSSSIFFFKAHEFCVCGLALAGALPLPPPQVRASLTSQPPAIRARFVSSSQELLVSSPPHCFVLPMLECAVATISSASSTSCRPTARTSTPW